MGVGEGVGGGDWVVEGTLVWLEVTGWVSGDDLGGGDGG